MGNTILDGKHRKNIQIGYCVEIVEKHNQHNGNITQGFVKRILTKSSIHPHGIKVLLQSGKVGRVKAILDLPSK
jgi:uncharacterized repeat protein (TIGR03833 family)